jgi:hypothetical protein
MIVFQSSGIGKGQNHRPCYSPSPGGDLSRLGSGERNLAKPKVAWRPSERARASQTMPSNRGSDELTIFSYLWENPRMIDFQSSAIAKSPSHRGRQSALIKVGRAYSRAVFESFSAPAWQKSVVQAGSIQGYPSLFKGFWEKIICFICHPAPGLGRSHPATPHHLKLFKRF